MRANWELVLLGLAQVVTCSLLAVVGLTGIAVAVGASFLLQLGTLDDWSAVLERLQSLAVPGALLALALAAFFILVAVVGWVYSWFQAGIMATLDRGERQAPPIRRLDWRLFRTFGGRDFAGWAGRGAWRYFVAFCGLFGIGSIVLGAYVAVIGLLAPRAAALESGAAAIAGCVALAPLVVLGVALNLLTLVVMALLARPDFGFWRSTRAALAILRRRAGGLLLLVALFVIAVVLVSVVFVPLNRGMGSAMPVTGAAWFLVQFLLTVAQWLVQGILNIALFGSTVALVRVETDAWKS